jgi:Bacteriophage HK97-gp10, putative tail-component
VIRVKVSGVPQYHAALEVLTEELQDGDLLLPAAEVIAKEARRQAPVRTGRLRSSIVADVGRRGNARVVALARYSPFVHYGSIHNPSPVPFLDRARNAPGVELAVEREVEKAIERAGL